jgi:hypothetical protein
LETVGLVPMTAEQFTAWLPGKIAAYAQESVVSGRWSEGESLKRSREDHDRLLPQGLATPDHPLWSIVRTSDREPVGMLWIQVMIRLEEEAKRLELEGIRLHVFGHNPAARPLYEKLGYVATNINMQKQLT